MTVGRECVTPPLTWGLRSGLPTLNLLKGSVMTKRRSITIRVTDNLSGIYIVEAYSRAPTSQLYFDVTGYINGPETVLDRTFIIYPDTP